MKTPKFLTTLILTAVGVACVQAQAPAPNAPAAQAPAGGGRGGGGRGGNAGPAFGVAQAIEVRNMATAIPADLTAAVTAARNALTAATFQSPADIPAKNQALADAELKLALARIDWFQKLQASPLKLNAEQVAFVAGGGSPGGGGGLAAPTLTMAYNDYSGFTKIFDGKTFTNWDGETDVWTIDTSVEPDNGYMHSDNSPGKTTGQHHIVYTGPGHLVKDFHLKVEFKLTAPGNPSPYPSKNPVEAGAGGRGGAPNGGVQYRSRLLAGRGANRSISDPATMANPLGTRFAANITTAAAATAAGITGGNPWQVSGYQMDLDGANQYTGQLYEGQGRSIVTPPGKIVQLMPGGLAVVTGTVADDVKPYIKEHKGLEGEWNQLEIIASGNVLTHILNGHVICITIDNDPVRRASQGIISLQLEGTGQVWYRNVYLKAL
jgi:hypothetical protein